MGSDGPEASLRKFKLPRKIFGDFSTVDPASVPRKLRSAIRKRSCEVTLPDSKGLSRWVNGVEPLRKDYLKQSKISMQKGFSDQTLKRAALLPISKDEEEVAETLSALAGMIPLNDVHTKDKMDSELLDAKASDLAEKDEDSMTAPQGSVIVKEEQKVTCHPASSKETKAAPIPNGSPAESMQEKSLIEPATHSWAKLSERRQLNLNLQVSVPPVKFQTTPPLLRTCDQRSWINSTFLGTSIQPNEMQVEKPLFPNSESHIKVGGVDVVPSNERQFRTSIERRDNGLTLRALQGSGVDGLSLQSSAIIFPSWLSTATSSSELGICENIVSTNKVSCSVDGRRKSWKKCAVHVYISRLIQALQNPVARDIQPSDTSQLRPSQCVNGGIGPLEHSNTARNETNGMVIASYRNTHEAASGIPVNQRLHLEQEGPSFSGCCGSKKQSYDFLSLSAGTGSAAEGHFNTTVTNMSHVRYPNSVVQNGTPVPFSMPQNRLPSNSYQGQVAAISGSPSALPQVHLQMPPYYGNPFGAAAHNIGSTAKSAGQQQSKQQQIWTASAQLATQFRPGPVLSSHIANWQNRRHDHQRSSTHHHMQPHLLPPQPSLQAFGPKQHLHISQQPPLQLTGLVPSVPPARAKPQQSHLPLQLMCNERL